MGTFEGLYDHPTPRPYPFGPSSVADILDGGLAAHPERLALIDGDRTWTWAELDAAVAIVAAGIAPGEQMWFALGNCAETIIGVLATFRAGGVAVFLPGNITVWLGQKLEERVGPTTCVWRLDSFTGFESLALRPGQDTGSIDPTAPAAIAFTSGTSGFPKAVVHSQRNLLLPGLVSIQVEPPEPGERIGTPLSLQIMNVMILGPFSALLRGSTFVVMKRTKAPDLAADVARHEVNRLFAVPALLHDLVELDDPAISMPSLDRVIVGGSGAKPGLLQSFAERFGVRPTVSYGMTEAPTGVVRESLDDPIGAGRGFPLPHVKVSIRNEDGSECAAGETGEICLEPADEGKWANCWTPTLGYLGDPDRTAALYAGGQLHTGDRGVLHADGALSVTGRLSNIIIRGGMNVDPQAVTDVLLDDPAVEDAIVCGYPDDRLGERTGALVVPVDGEKVDRERLRTSVAEALSRHAVPDAIVTVHRIPRGSMGKVTGLQPEFFAQGDDDVRVFPPKKGRPRPRR